MGNKNDDFKYLFFSITFKCYTLSYDNYDIPNINSYWQ